MANSDRRKDYVDRNNNMLIPINVEGGVWNEHFITTPKLICIVLIIIALVFIIMSLNAEGKDPTFFSYLFWVGLWAFVSSFILRFIVFEEKFYYRMYKEMQKYEITTPAVFWGISSIKDTEHGAILTYADGSIGIMVKLDRDTITGKNEDFKEIHYDAISDFYKSVMTNRYSFVQMNIMEQAGKDPRLNELSKLVNKSDNPNVRKLMEMQIGHIKNITNTTLYESDYFLFYTHDMSKVDSIIEDIEESLLGLMDGAFIGFSVLLNKDIVELVKEIYGVTYFNETQASLFMFDSLGATSALNISGLLWTDGNDQKLNNSEITRLRGVTSEVIRGTKLQEDVSLKKTFYKVNDENKNEISFDDLSEVKPNNRSVSLEKRGNAANENNGNALSDMDIPDENNSDLIDF